MVETWWPGFPVVDFSKVDCLKPGTSSWLSARKDVCRALEELGCFMAILPSKVPPELHKTIFNAFDELFNFPVDTPDNPLRAGYVTSRSGQKTFGIINGTNPQENQEFTHLFWPNGITRLIHLFLLHSETADLYAKVMAEIDEAVTRMVFENYGVDKYHDDHFRSTFYYLRFIKYKEPKKLGVDVGLRSHTDKTFSSILHQNHVHGLEINTKNDEWVVFDPLPSSVIFMAGDVFQVWSNDRVRPCRHRVTLKENEVRYSFGLFSLHKGVIHVPDELVDKDHPLRYKPFNHLEFLRAQRDLSETEYAAKAYCAI
ncbi:putative 2-oxoglutarate-dependent dioxygenase AOP1 [Prunus yedoensis var. nudiflora]|uniref:Putative 2-oxoglutarate-dependent dioxygenase AOP1 n=1 Tax=Prunus yedoensis var. nudiflora TaxID=2094558 RepID=A0A314ULK8_PRUYE|nr:putative 2-oxoglutarate-dependent dioxygenase AOP1 [Prunus yedoensis var. nudiflora]